MTPPDASSTDPDWKRRAEYPPEPDDTDALQIQGLCRPGLGTPGYVRVCRLWDGPIGHHKLADWMQEIAFWAFEHGKGGEMPEILVEAWRTRPGRSIVYAEIPVTAETWAEVIQK